MDSQELETLKGAGSNESVASDGSSDMECEGSEWMTSEKVDKERGLWANKLEFFLAIVGYTIGVGSVWRFPIICR